MRKSFILSSILTLALLFSACSEKQNEGIGPDASTLAKPSLSIASQTEDSFKVFWPEVEGATYYVVIFQGTEEEIITDNHYEKSDLALGSYTVTVKACSNEEGVEDSETSEITVVLTEETWFTQSVEPYRWDNPDYPDYIYLYDTYNSLSMTFTVSGTQIRSIDYALLEASESADMTREELIARIQSNNKSIPSSNINDLNTNGSISLFAPNIKANTSFEFVSVATNSEGWQVLRRSPVTTDPVPAPHEDIAAWIGNWTVTSSHTHSFYYDEKASESGSNMFPDTLRAIPQTFEVNISIDESYANSLIITGLSVTHPELPARGIYKPEEKSLDIYCGIEMGYDPLSIEYGIDCEYMWFGTPFDVPAGTSVDDIESTCSMTLTSGFVPVYKMSMYGNIVECENNRIFFDDGSSYYMFGMEIMSERADAGGILPHLDDAVYPLELRAGKLTWAKK